MYYYLEATSIQGKYTVIAKSQKQNKLLNQEFYQYANFLEHIKIPKGFRTKRTNTRTLHFTLDSLILFIEQVYTERFATDTNLFKTASKSGEINNQSFGSSVYEFLNRGKKSDKQLAQVRIILSYRQLLIY